MGMSYIISCGLFTQCKNVMINVYNNVSMLTHPYLVQSEQSEGAANETQRP